MNFSLDEAPTDLIMEIPNGAGLRCPHYNLKTGRICNKLFCKGEASPKPQEFKCPNCGKKTVYKSISR